MAMKVCVVTITPAMAEDLLARNYTNRPVRPYVVQKYTGQMLSGKWDLNGESIVIDMDGNLLDGQHRLLAVIQSGIPLVTVMVSGVDPSAFKTIDTGSARTGRDLLSLSGLKTSVASTAAAAAVKCILFEHTRKMRLASQYTHLVTPARCYDYAIANPRLIDLAEKVLDYGVRSRVLTASISTALWFLMERKAFKQTEMFFEGVLTGADLSPNDPRLRLRQQLEMIGKSKRTWNVHTKTQAVIRAWDWYIRGRECRIPGNMFRDLEKAMELLL